MSNAQSQAQHTFHERALEGMERMLSDENATASAGQAETDQGWQRHPLNIRLSIPLLFGRWFITIVGGPERRDDQRRVEERKKHPLFKLGNVVFLFLVGTVLGTAAAVLMVKGTMQALGG